MNERQIQAEKIESKYAFMEVDKTEFNEYIIKIKKDKKLLDVNGCVYYGILPYNTIIAKNDYSNRRYYLTKKV